ncbi:TniB family NTP-binding protein [Robbsia andropogonis]|uniref:TniB family NTP-binding protein n=1 Tax=Robbsia andropogonis TaxID=28092 RepID=UPI0009DDC4AB|nr:TniB family NTP-binding protein [Robbsia andropogonis]
MKNNPSCNDLVKKIRSSFLRLPHVDKIFASLERMRSYESDGEEPENLLLIGESGVGKSTVVHKFMLRNPRIEHDEFTEIPVLYVALGQSPTPRIMASTILREMGDPKWNLGKEIDLTTRLVHLIRQCHVRIVIIDEANHLIDRGGEKTLHTAADWLKRLVDATKVSFVLAGIPRTRNILLTNDQLRGRFREVIEIDRFTVMDKSAEIEFRRLLMTFNGYMKPFSISSFDLSNAANTRLFAFATDGRLRDICRLLVRAVELSFEKSDQQLTNDVLADAFSSVIYPGAPAKRNPFHKSFNEMPLVGAGEPFSPVVR